MAAFSETLALAVVVSKGIPPLKDALIAEPEDRDELDRNMPGFKSESEHGFCIVLLTFWA